MTLFINTEIALRELESNLAAGLSAANRGELVIIADQRQLPMLVSRALTGPGILHTKSVPTHPALRKTFKRAREKGFVVTSIDQEGGFLDASYEDFLEERFPPDTFDYVDFIFTWGKWDADNLIKKFPNQSENIIAGGAARLDLWKNSSVSAARPNWIPDGPFVLFSSNIVSNGHYRHWDIIKEVVKSGQLALGSAEIRNFFGVHSDSMKMHLEFLELFDFLSAELPEVKFVIRPHPTEDIDAWKTLLPPRDNIVISRFGSITPWIKHSQAVIHSGCTSGLEATISQIPVIYYEPRTVRGKESNLTRELGLLAQSPPAVKTALKEILRQSTVGEPVLTPPQWVRDRFGEALSDRSSAISVLNRVWESQVKVKSSRHSVLTLLRVAFFSNIQILLSQVREKIFRLSPAYSLEKFPNLRTVDLKAQIEYLSELFEIPPARLVLLSSKAFALLPPSRTWRKTSLPEQRFDRS